MAPSRSWKLLHPRATSHACAHVAAQGPARYLPLAVFTAEFFLAVFTADLVLHACCMRGRHVV